MNQPFKPQDKGTIAVIGGGLGGSLTALMLARHGYHVKLIESQDTILNGASRIAARLHLGGEYPRHKQTREDCVDSAVIWKLLMPKNIYTGVNKMKFLVTERSQALGLREAAGETLSEQEKKEALTVSEYLGVYEAVRVKYESVVSKVKVAFNDIQSWGLKDVEDKLFGSAAPNRFFHQLAPEEYKDYKGIVGGFQSPEHGLDPVRYLAMLQHEIESLKGEGGGHIEVLTGHKVKPAVKPDGTKNESGGITGSLKNFEVHCKIKGKNGKMRDRIIRADQVVNAAWSGGPAIIPEITDKDQPEIPIYVHRRAMMVVDLPKNWKTDPAFVMRGTGGGMVSAFNDKAALVYLPMEATAYIKTKELTNSNPNLPADWNDTPDIKERTAKYFELAKKRFPFLEGTSNPRLLIDDTIAFDDDLAHRPAQKVQEVAKTSDNSGIAGMQFARLPKQKAVTRQEMGHSTIEEPVREVRKGLFALYPTKATYGVKLALQTALMVEQRYRSEHIDIVEPPEDLLALLSDKYSEHLKRFTLENMKLPESPEFWTRFFKEHPDLRANMMSGEMPEAVKAIYEQQEAAKQIGQPAQSYWQNTVMKRQPPQSIGY